MTYFITQMIVLAYLFCLIHLVWMLTHAIHVQMVSLICFITEFITLLKLAK